MITVHILGRIIFSFTRRLREAHGLAELGRSHLDPDKTSAQLISFMSRSESSSAPKDCLYSMYVVYEESLGTFFTYHNNFCRPKKEVYVACLTLQLPADGSF